jgi:hypothetical protein
VETLAKICPFALPSSQGGICSSLCKFARGSSYHPECEISDALQDVVDLKSAIKGMQENIADIKKAVNPR